MNTLKIKLILGFILIVIITSCEKADNNTESDFEYIEYGTSFNMCIGYCIRSINITDSKIVFKKSGWNFDEILPDKSLTETVDQHYWTQLIKNIDFDSFLQLEQIIGCPDCADGGAEWIEIKKNDIKHKVTFEYFNEPETVKDYVGFLRIYFSAFETDSTGYADF